MTNPSIKSLDDIRKSVSEQIAKSSSQDELVDNVVNIVTKYCFEVEIVKRRLAALEALERAKDSILQHYKPEKGVSLAETVTVEAQEALATDGLHELEYEEGGPAFRWTGPGSFSRFVVWVDRSAEIIVRLETLEGGDLRNPKELVLAVDGKAYRLRQDAFPNTYYSDPIPAIESGGPTEVVLHVPFLFRPSDNGDDDNRILGIKFHRLELARVEG
jgi:hypothetical protein